MREKASVLLACVCLLVVLVACKGAGASASTDASPAASATAERKPWLEQARVSWPDAAFTMKKPDGGGELAHAVIKYKSPPQPVDVAEHVRALLAIDALDRPCAVFVDGEDSAKHDADADAVYFLGLAAIEPGVAYNALSAKDMAKRLVERDEPAASSFACTTKTWMIVNTPGHFLHNWRAYVRDYSNVWDGSKKNVLEAEKLCESAADLDLYRGETFPDSGDAIDNGVRFPQMSGQTIKWRSYTNWEKSKSWFDCTVNANEAPSIAWDHARD